MTETVAFAFLLVASVAITCWRAVPVIRSIVGAREEADFRLRPLNRRVWRFIRQVLLQSKVIGERPLPGLAHALVFWGFLAFAAVTVDHLAAGFGRELLVPGSPFELAYSALAAVFAVAVAVAIGGLAVRRFLVRPRWLGEVSPESGLIALLIFALMVTYLAEYFTHPSAYLWWIHTICLLVFLPLIPGTKHLHLILGPAAVFLGRGGFSQIPPLSGDEDFGLATGKDVTRLTALEAHACVECGRCTEHCPAHATGKELNPKQLTLGIRSYLKEFGPAGSAEILGSHVSETEVFQCTTCGACEYQCPVGVEHIPLIVGLRRGAVNTGRWEDEHGSRLFLNLERFGNPLGVSASERDKFIRENELPLYDGSQDYCFWLGCMGAYDPDGRETVLATARLLSRLGITFGVLRRERCTGDAARRLGNDLAFEELASFNLEQLESAGVKRLLSICPHCVRTISEDWREYGEAPLIEHHSELLARHRMRLSDGAGPGGSVVFHDPCYLGRYRNVYDEPRQVVAAGARLREAKRSRERSFCCGAGGGLVFLGEEQGTRISEERARQLIATGAETVAVACPFCRTMFRDALGGMEDPPRLVDIAQLTRGEATTQSCSGG